MPEAASTKSATEKGASLFERRPRELAPELIASGPEASILALQRTAGNQAVKELLGNKKAALGSNSNNDSGEMNSVTRHMEGAFGISFAGITLRTDAGAASRAEKLGARAYTDGHEVGFGAGVFDPSSRQGLRTIAHEFAHVAQSLGGTGSRKGTAFNQVSAGGILTKGNDPATDTDTIEADADAAAEAVIGGGKPEVLAAELLTVAKEDRDPKKNVPPRGSFFVSATKDGGFVYTFNGEEALSWKNPTLTVVSYYFKDAFPGITQEVIADVALKLGMSLTDNVPRETIRQQKIMRVGVSGKIHSDVVKLMARDYPQFKSNKPQIGQRAVGSGGAGTGGGQKEPPKKEDKGVGQGTKGQQKEPADRGEGANLPTTTPPPADAKVPVITVTDLKQIDELKNRGLIAVDSANKIKAKLEKQEVLTFEEAVTLIDGLNRLFESGKEENTKEGRESWLKWAKFIQENKEKISGKSKTDDKGITVEEVKEIIKKHKEFVGVKDVPATKSKDAVYDPERRKSWNSLKDWEKKLWDDYLKKYGDTADVTDQSSKDLTITSDVRFSMALRMSPQYMEPGAREAAQQLFNDPIFIGSLIAGITIYLALWLAPEPVFTKAAAILTTIGLLSLVAFSVSEIKNLAEAWMQLSADSAEARSLPELEAAAEKFGKAIGASGLRILVALATVLLGKALPTPKPLPPIEGGGGGMVAAGAGGGNVVIARPVTATAVVVKPNGAIIIVTGPAGGMAMTGGGGEGASGGEKRTEKTGAGEKKEAPAETQDKTPEKASPGEKTTSATSAEGKGATVVQQEVVNPNVKVGSGEPWTGKGGEPQWSNPKSTKAYDHIESTHGPKVKPNQFEGRMGSTGTSKSQGQWYDVNDWVAAEQATPKQPGRYVIDFKRPIGRVYKAGGPPTENVTRAFVRRLPDGTLDTAFPVTDDYTF